MVTATHQKIMTTLDVQRTIHLLSSAFQKHQITIKLCNNDADTSIVKAALAAAKDDSVENPMNGCYVANLLFSSFFFRYGQKMLMC